jgi:hypothetical protein
MSIDLIFLYEPISYYSENMRFAKPKTSIFVKFYEEPGISHLFASRKKRETIQPPGRRGNRIFVWFSGDRRWKSEILETGKQIEAM